MKQNKYDDAAFFEQYNRMDRSQKGLDSAGEWHALREMLPDFNGKRVLDLGCGFGWHCRYAAEHGASEVVGVDLSHNMLTRARELTDSDRIQYIEMPIEDIDFPENSFDVVLSSLTFHYIADFGAMCDKVARVLKPGGVFVFSAEHPVFTAYGDQDWHRDERGEILHWPVDRYFYEGARDAVFLGEPVVKCHRTLTTYLGELLRRGFLLEAVVEPQPPEDMLGQIEGMEDELRRPMMLLVRGRLEK